MDEQIGGGGMSETNDQRIYDRCIIRVGQLEAENAKLRELAARLIRHIEDPPCESCMSEMSCAGGEGLTNCDEYQFMVCDAHELGVDA